MLTTENKSSSGTFRENKDKAIHKWYPYIEGYSYNFIENELNKLSEKPQIIYDPFGGSGTTPLVASQHGIKSIYSETNPIMQFITNTKINITRGSINKWEKVEKDLQNLIDEIERLLPVKNIEDSIKYGGFEKYFDIKVLKELLIIKNAVYEVCKTNEAIQIGKLALASITVYVSNMVRRSDLRYSKPNEKSEVNKDVKLNYIKKLQEIMLDMIEVGNTVLKDTHLIEEDVRHASFDQKVNAIITSPPYLNGTNYVRNTKLELKMLGYVETEQDLPPLHSKGIIAGINSVSKRNTVPEVLDIVEEYVEKLNHVAYDSRIPVMVAGYFYDMNNVIKKLSSASEKNGKFILDIGDSQFAGIHIPTHSLLAMIAEQNGFEQYDEEILRNRRSNNGMKLTQRVLRFNKI